MTDTSESYSPATISLATPSQVPTPIIVPYSEERATEILDLYMDGVTFKDIAKIPGMPADKTLRHWLTHNESFRVRVQSARATKALLHEERALYLAERAVAEAPQEQHVAAHRLGFDAHKWAAEINDPARYGKKTTISGDPDRPLTFIISTGFPAPNKSQTHPQLDSGGLIIKEVAAVVTEVAHDGTGEANERSPEDSGNAAGPGDAQASERPGEGLFEKLYKEQHGEDLT